MDQKKRKEVAVSLLKEMEVIATRMRELILTMPPHDLLGVCSRTPGHFGAGMSDLVGVRTDGRSNENTHFRQEEVAATLRRAEIRMIDTLGAVIGKAQVSGEVPDEISTRQAAATIIACIDGFMSRIAFTPISAEAQLAGFVMLITAALRLQQS
jgi:hypothetical protein